MAVVVVMHVAGVRCIGRMRSVVPMTGWVVVPFMSCAMVLVAVVPQLGLVQQEEEHQACQQHREQQVRVATVLEGLGQQVHEGGGQQGAGRQAQEVLGVEPGGAATFAADAQADQEGGHPDTADAGAEGGEEGGEQGHAKQ